ncbi:hypothetical protein [Paraflavitalea sp. CAU 1676]|uniref:hypothetical protein n=1 Tax=Paraflavitalea sp. CAU 1676 TaxID=3032598 RepID=UPI0023D9B0D9|nr:hypothetical protein [Paraflavitalea sp. CAU 1676]MDF2188359.1 hypothetical protein [Paraflavitalea sp. CAU 1676]
MKLKGREKFFWERNFNIKSLSAIPSAISGITGIDSSHDDEFFYYLSSRVQQVGSIHLRCTDLTVTQLKKLQQLFISSSLKGEELDAMVGKLQHHFPDCAITVF